MRPLIKICGLRRTSDALLARDLGASLLGVVTAEDSPRGSTRNEVASMARISSLRSRLVLVFRGVERGAIHDLARTTAVQRVQIHGASEEDCVWLEDCGLLVHRVYQMNAGSRYLPALEPPPTRERPAVLDLGCGGGGQAFDWNLLGERAPDATYVAGGIRPDNVQALLKYKPYGIDVSSGVEASPGVKDPAAMRQLFDAMEMKS